MSAPDPPCPDKELALHALVDGELDMIHAVEIEQHIERCPRCAAATQGLQQMRALLGDEDVAWRAPHSLKQSIVAAIAREAPARARWRKPALLDRLGRWSLVPSAAALAASLFLVAGPLRQTASMQDEIVASHVRSLLASHLTDVATSNRHTVKPWFAGHVDFSPPVVDLSERGFPLVGGRVDYLGGRTVAAIVYKRDKHVINLLIWPSADQTTTTPAASARDGYNLLNWTSGGLDFWAISDVAPADLADFQSQFADAARN